MTKHPKPEEIVAKLRQADVLISQGQSVADAIRALGLQDQLVQRQIGDGFSKPSILGLKTLHPSNLIRLQAAKLTPPPVVCH
jgi:putative transposase